MIIGTSRLESYRRPFSPLRQDRSADEETKKHPVPDFLGKIFLGTGRGPQNRLAKRYDNLTFGRKKNRKKACYGFAGVRTRAFSAR